MPAESQYLRVRLEMEQHRLVDWSHVAGLIKIETTDHLTGSLRINRHLLLDVLTEIKTVLDNFGKAKGRYAELRPIESDAMESRGQLGKGAAPDMSAKKPPRTMSSRFYIPFRRGTSSSMEKLLDLIDLPSEIPKKLRWATFDKAKFEGLLQRLGELNDFLQGLMDESQTRTLQRVQHQTYMEILQLHNNLEDLKQLVRALSSEPTAGPRSGGIGAYTGETSTETIYQKEEKRSLERLARFKVFNTTIDGSTDAATLESTKLDIAHIILPTGSGDDYAQTRTEALYRPLGKQPERRVWIEWKSYEPTNFSDAVEEPDAKIVVRVRQLAAILGQRNKPREFRAPHCLGYCYDCGTRNLDGEPRFGYVFDKPEDVPASAKPVSLLDLIRASNPHDQQLHNQQRRRGPSIPSLADRVALAGKITASILYLHSVNWLHKSLRSENVVFFPEPFDHSYEDDNGDDDDKEKDKENEDAAVDYNKPYLSGFDYARPSRSGEMTEKPPELARYDIYRHPRVQGGSSSSESFKKSFDIYSLGLVLLEIAMWMPVDRIVGIEDLGEAGPKVVGGVRETLLGGGSRISCGGGSIGQGKGRDKESLFIQGVRARLGDFYADAVRACLVGAEAFGVGADEDETGEGAGARLQAGFCERVVDRLGAVRV
jgi:Prion-inhibition and propagation